MFNKKKPTTENTPKSNVYTIEGNTSFKDGDIIKPKIDSSAIANIAEVKYLHDGCPYLYWINSNIPNLHPFQKITFENDFELMSEFISRKEKRGEYRVATIQMPNGEIRYAALYDWGIQKLGNDVLICSLKSTQYLIGKITNIILAQYYKYKIDYEIICTINLASFNMRQKEREKCLKIKRELIEDYGLTEKELCCKVYTPYVKNLLQEYRQLQKYLLE